MSADATSAALSAGVRSRSSNAVVRFVVDALGYGAASAVALAADYGVLLLLVKVFGAQYLVAACISFSVGLIVAYALSTAFVFKGRARYGARGEFAGFFITGLCGLALNQILLLAFVGGLHLPVEYAKAPTAGFVFTFNFLTRRLLLFRPACD
jgi:putative flippase GtrA